MARAEKLHRVTGATWLCLSLLHTRTIREAEKALTACST